jgi:hypothetical protein
MEERAKPAELSGSAQGRASDGGMQPTQRREDLESREGVGAGMRISWCEADDLFGKARARLATPEVALDIGCGIRPQQLVTPHVHVCCEPFPEYARYLLDKVQSTLVVLQLSWAQALDVLPEKSVDSVFLLDVIEHLEKEEGSRLLAATERITRGQIVVFTPLGFMPQPRTGAPDAWGLGGDEVQEHKSGWTPDDFDHSWEIVASKDFHKTDAHGRSLPDPFGAFFAIKTVGSGRAAPREGRAHLLERIGAYAQSIPDEAVLSAAAEMVRASAELRRPWLLAPSRALLVAGARLKQTSLATRMYELAVRIRRRLSGTPPRA